MAGKTTRQAATLGQQFARLTRPSRCPPSRPRPNGGTRGQASRLPPR